MSKIQKSCSPPPPPLKVKCTLRQPFPGMILYSEQSVNGILHATVQVTLLIKTIWNLN